MTIRKLALGSFVVTVLLAAASTTGRPLDTEPRRMYAASASEGKSTFSEADRLAIRDLIDAYGLAFFGYHADASLQLFTADALLVIGKSGSPRRVQSRETFRGFWWDLAASCRRNRDQRRHLISDVTFLEQSDSSAHVRIEGLLTNASMQLPASQVTNLNYEAWFVKQSGEWKISRWHDYPDLNGCAR